MAERALAEMLADLRQSQEALLDILSRADDATLYRRLSDDSWSLAEVLVHIAEARQFFTAETGKVLATPGVKMGRTIDNPERLRNVQDNASNPSAVIREKLVASHQAITRTLEGMSEPDLLVTGEHVKYGPQTLAKFIQHFLVEHDQTHVQQASALLAGEIRSD